MCHSVSMHLNLIYQQRACVYPPPPCPDLHHLHPHSPVAGTLLCEVLQPLWWSIGDGLQVPGIVWFYYINHMIPHVWWEKRERPDNRYKNYLLVSHVSGEIGESHMFSGRNYKNDV